MHAQKLFRLTDTVVFCFDGDAAGRKAAWRALENTLPVLADGKNALFLFLPDGEDPDDYVRRRGRAAFEQAMATAVPLSEFLLAELAARHPPTSAEGRAALVAAARPYLGEIAAPVLAALLRKRLAQLSGLPEDELRGLLGTAAPAPEGRPLICVAARPGSARPASAVDDAPVHSRALAGTGAGQDRSRSRTGRAHARDGGAHGAGRPLRRGRPARRRRPGVLQAFADSPHAGCSPRFWRRPKTTPSTTSRSKPRCSEGLERWWQQARRSGRPAPTAEVVLAGRRAPRCSSSTMSASGRPNGRAPGASAEPPDGHPPEGARRDII